MPSQEPAGAREPRTTDVDARYSSEGVAATPWSQARDALEAARLSWISTVRPDGRPHVTPLSALWQGDALYFSTGPDERKARNLEANPEVVLTTGTNLWDKGLDVVVEGTAVRVTDDARLRELAAAWEEKYGGFFHYEVRDGCFQHESGQAYVFAVTPRTAFGFGKGEPFSQTRYRFA
ncbi:pyridoxamine 5'-phosphate oxidase family protein [Streptomyces lasiicapitis]|uniref:pyridoxamine 5'-phosphate oxidase family protein n=1 Tax=Streptomyces lasiicapitis TaxID=1923961 RepID=UPI00367801A1